MRRWGDSLLGVVGRLAGAWLIASVCFLLSIQIQLLWIRLLARPSLTFDYLVFWTLGDWIKAVLYTPVPLLIVFLWTEVWRIIRKKSLPFVAYAIFPVVFFLIWAIKVCTEETGIFVRLYEYLKVPEDLFFYFEGGIWLVLMIFLSIWASKLMLTTGRRVTLPTS